MAPHFDPALGGDAPPTRPDEGAPVLGGLRGHPPWLTELLKGMFADQGMARRSARAGRHYQVVLAMAQAETGLERHEIEALIGFLFPE
jgi:hypothetical protein